MKLIDLVGQRFGRWTVKSRTENDKRGNAMWLCKCDCGSEKLIVGYSLKNGESLSCGCYSKESASKRQRQHGHNTTKGASPEYISWAGIKARCTNQNNPAYKNYGGRGISVCDRWLKFENFYEDMGKRPSSKHSIDRIDVNGNYCPENCRWATPVEQVRNQRIMAKNKSGVRGVSWHKPTSKYVVRITINYTTLCIGYTDSFEEAKRMRQESELKYWGKSS